MKLRTNKQSIRLRLSQSELAIFKEKRTISEQILFPGPDKNCLSYTLEICNAEQIAARLTDNNLIVSVPAPIADHWINSDEVGFQTTLYFDDTNALFILVEKDFQCLTPRPMEDESDNFPNPNQQC